MKTDRYIITIPFNVAIESKTFFQQVEKLILDGLDVDLSLHL